MPLLCLVCDTRVEASLVKANSYWCPGCEKELKRDETYKVGKRHFAGNAGTIIAVAKAMSAAIPGLHRPETLKRKKDKVSAFIEAKRKKRKKLKGLKMKRKRHERRKNSGKKL